MLESPSQNPTIRDLHTAQKYGRKQGEMKPRDETNHLKIYQPFNPNPPRPWPTPAKFPNRHAVRTNCSALPTMKNVRTIALLFAAAFSAQAAGIMPLRDIKPGMKGTGRTVFSGYKIESFDVEILGILENAGPKQSIILARLSGGPLEHTGIMQGMSGSPVYIDGKLAGAVALAFPFAKDPIAGIRPIEEMLRSNGPSTSARTVVSPVRLDDKTLTDRLPKTEPVQGHLVEIATPVTFTGFPATTVEQFAPQLRALGLEPVQSLSGGKSIGPPPPTPLEPGGMISVELLTGDMSVGADGTVTHIDGNRVYAFGHRFLAAGSTELPFARANVIALLPSANSSFKISSTGPEAGVILDDNSVGVSGELGRKPAMVPLRITVNNRSSYSMQMINDPLLSPLLLQMAIYSSLDATERTLGVSTIGVKGVVEFAGNEPPFRWENIYAGDFNVPLQTSLNASLPIAYALQNNTDALKLRSVQLDLETNPEKRQMHIEDVWTNKRQLRPGERLEIMTLLAGDKGAEVTQKVAYDVPIGAPAGTMYITVADGPVSNAADQKILNLSEPRPATQIISLLNTMRGNTRAYVRLWKQDPAYTVQGADLPDPPASLGLILARSPGSTGAYPKSSTIAELDFGVKGLAISGARTIQVEIKE